MHFAQCTYQTLPHMGNKCLLVFVDAVTTVNRGLPRGSKRFASSVASPSSCCIHQTGRGGLTVPPPPPNLRLLLPTSPPSPPPPVTISD